MAENSGACCHRGFEAWRRVARSLPAGPRRARIMRAGAPKPGMFGSGGGSGGEGAGVSSPVAVERQAVDHEGVAQQVEQLTFVADAVGAAQPEGVIQVAVDALGVVAAR